MTSLVFLVFYQIYFLGSAVLFFHLCKKCFLNSANLSFSWGMSAILLMLTWPVALLTRSGRAGIIVLFE